jgi:LacI family transcriptional regulator
VLEAAKQLGYVPNAHARSLAAGLTRTLGMIVSDIENPFFPEVIKGFETCARELGYEVILSDTNYEAALMDRAAVRMLGQKVRGVAIMTSEWSPHLVEDFVSQRIAVTFLDLGPVQRYVSNIKIDYLSGIRQVVQHLFDLGHRRIAFAGGRSTLRSNVTRHNAYVDSMCALGLEPLPAFPGNLRFDGGFAAGEAILRVSPIPTAVVAVNDLTAVGVIKAFHKHGLHVPKDLSVTGFDRTHLAEYIVPSLTTVDLHRDLLGQTAAKALHELLSTRNPQGREYFIPAEMILGESTGPVPLRERSPASISSGVSGP